MLAPALELDPQRCLCKCFLDASIRHITYPARFLIHQERARMGTVMVFSLMLSPFITSRSARLMEAVFRFNYFPFTFVSPFVIVSYIITL